MSNFDASRRPKFTWRLFLGSGLFVICPCLRCCYISVSSSSDGNKLAAVDYNGYVWLSTNAGVAWTAQTGGLPTTALWWAVASSADATKLVAAVNNGNLWLSGNSGTSWAQQASAAPTVAGWRDVASSADGTKLAAAADTGGGGKVWLSSDSGSTWGAQTGGRGGLARRLPEPHGVQARRRRQGRADLAVLQLWRDVDRALSRARAGGGGELQKKNCL